MSTGTLIGRVDPGSARIQVQPFVIGTQGSVEMPNDGVLQLGVNDSVLGDNSGWFTVVVAPQAQPAATAPARRR